MEDIRITNSEHPKRIRETSFWMNPCWIFFWFTHYFVIKAMNHVTFQAVKNRRFFKTPPLPGSAVAGYAQTWQVPTVKTQGTCGKMMQNSICHHMYT